MGFILYYDHKIHNLKMIDFINQNNFNLRSIYNEFLSSNLLLKFLANR